MMKLLKPFLTMLMLAVFITSTSVPSFAGSAHLHQTMDMSAPSHNTQNMDCHT